MALERLGREVPNGEIGYASSNFVDRREDALGNLNRRSAVSKEEACSTASMISLKEKNLKRLIPLLMAVGLLVPTVAFAAGDEACCKPQAACCQPAQKCCTEANGALVGADLPIDAERVAETQAPTSEPKPEPSQDPAAAADCCAEGQPCCVEGSDCCSAG